MQHFIMHINFQFDQMHIDLALVFSSYLQFIINIRLVISIFNIMFFMEVSLHEDVKSVCKQVFPPLMIENLSIDGTSQLSKYGIYLHILTFFLELNHSNIECFWFGPHWLASFSYTSCPCYRSQANTVDVDTNTSLYVFC